ncbi:hypothetical protein ACFQVC_09280 [Streptomyces monticola]|uniref:MarR family transcriptional regulator n=1 Tax=Streptomyces monticola TaxID=2666263 RepID=A0ABW2JFX7_9ACTN
MATADEGCLVEAAERRAGHPGLSGPEVQLLDDAVALVLGLVQVA